MFRRKFIRDSLGAAAGAVGAHSLISCGKTRDSGQRGQITFGSYADPALDIFKETMLPEFEKLTGIHTEWVEADFSGWSAFRCPASKSALLHRHFCLASPS